ncbi:HAD-IIA family hydrolase [Marinobacter confluentis]|uniref:HAD-IIA family hydrolase n=1 Tax=Marinobacter confluentis TaxID=1697557 RepID=A0A4Z1BP30_9GAMM|nr:HAD-IIA family hydrolase [Marinobacter confluentis]TGN38801.1 HAD-IIA family hydrolase [Marinobacter confluentis]
MKDTHPTCFDGLTPTPTWAFEQYQRLQYQLPYAEPNQNSPQRIESLEPLTSQFDAFVFDAFGVLNAGADVIVGAPERLASLQANGKPVLVLSNAATVSQKSLTEKYQEMGFDLIEDQIISSRWLLEDHLAGKPSPGIWGVIAPPHSGSQSLPGIDQKPVRPGISDEDLDAFDGFIFMSSEDWTETLQTQLTASLCRRPRPLRVANPDLVAPRGDSLTLEPGYFAHQLRRSAPVHPEFFGKPYSLAFDAALGRLGNPPPHRVLMIGDTLHTDILGGRASGMATLLICNHGSLKGMDIDSCIRQSGISPDFIAPSI